MAEASQANKKYTIRFISFYLREKMGWLGLGYLISALQKLELLTVESRFYKISEVERAVRETVEDNPQIIGLSVLQSELLTVKEYALKVKKALPTCHITAGNKEVSDQPQIMMEWCQAIDSIVIGEGEETIIDLVQRLWTGSSLKDCLGIYYRENGEIYKNPARPLISNIESIAYPDREISPPYIDNDYVKAYPVFTARGCKGNCSFCVAESRIIRTRTLGDVFKEIKILIDKYDASYIVFGDSSFEDGGQTPKMRYEELLETLQNSHLSFRFLLSSRTETITPEIAKLMKMLVPYGLDRVNIGVESGNDKDLKTFNKIARMHHNRRALDLLNQEKVPYSPYIIMYNPYSSLEGLRENINFFHEYKLIYTFRMLTSRFMAFSGARLTQRLFRDGLMHKGTTYPITDGFSYRFYHPVVDKIWSITEKIDDILSEPLKLNMNTCYDMLSLVDWLNVEENVYKGKEQVIGFSKSVDNLLQQNDQFLFEIYNYLLDYAPNASVEETIQEMIPYIHHANEVTQPLWKDIQRKKLIITYQLKKNGHIPLRYFTISRRFSRLPC
jgi:anaerobic magnesium-protoporphyrin IX monomethyl ester cyclase